MRHGTYVAEAEVSSSEVVGVGNISRRGGAAALVQRYGFSSATRTDSKGQFTLNDVPKSDVFLLFRGSGIVTIGGYQIPKGSDPTKLEVTCQVRAHFRLELADKELADSFQVISHEGRQLPIYEIKGYADSTRYTQALRDGKSRVFSISDAAESVRLMYGDEEVGTVPLILKPGGVAVVR